MKHGRFMPRHGEMVRNDEWEKLRKGRRKQETEDASPSQSLPEELHRWQSSRSPQQCCIQCNVDEGTGTQEGQVPDPRSHDWTVAALFGWL